MTFDKHERLVTLRAIFEFDQRSTQRAGDDLDPLEIIRKLQLLGAVDAEIEPLREAEADQLIAALSYHVNRCQTSKDPVVEIAYKIGQSIAPQEPAP